MNGISNNNLSNIKQYLCHSELDSESPLFATLGDPEFPKGMPMAKFRMADNRSSLLSGVEELKK